MKNTDNSDVNACNLYVNSNFKVHKFVQLNLVLRC